MTDAVGRSAAFWPAVPLMLVMLPFLVSAASRPGPSHMTRMPGPSDTQLELLAMEERLERVQDGVARVERYYDDEVAPIERILSRFSGDEALVRRIAVSLVREGRRVGVDSRVLTSVLLVENPWLAPDARSPVGAVGLMQVMPLHAGQWGCGSGDLTDVEVNICHGARVFAHVLERSGGDVDRALLSYNGCVRGTNTPDCHLYPDHVYARAGRAALLGWLSETDEREDQAPVEAAPTRGRVDP